MDICCKVAKKGERKRDRESRRVREWQKKVKVLKYLTDKLQCKKEMNQSEYIMKKKEIYEKRKQQIKRECNNERVKEKKCSI